MKQSGATKPAGHYVASDSYGNVDEKIELLKSLGSDGFSRDFSRLQE